MIAPNIDYRFICGLISFHSLAHLQHITQNKTKKALQTELQS